MIPPGVSKGGKHQINGCVVPVEDVALIAAGSQHWTWQQTLEQPMWLLWDLMRFHADQAKQIEQQRKGR